MGGDLVASRALKTGTEPAFFSIVRRPLSLLRKGSRSSRLWESPHVPPERYKLRPCLCVFVARFDRQIFYYS